MVDKYEEFKEWFKKRSHRYGVWKIDDNDNQEICHYSRAFIDFEEEQAEKDKKEEIIMEITKIKMNTGIVMPSGYVYSNITFNSAEKIYDKLKEKDLIK